jgi:1,4-dihydroxy-2-naphthoyl-CoA hydrolase
MRSHFDSLLGTEWISDDPEDARVRVQMRDELRQPVGLLHGGVMSSLVESVCSRATALAVMGDGMMAMGQSISVSFIRPVTEGTAEVHARARHRGRTGWVWDAEVLNDEEKICALAQMTVAVRPLPDQD